MDTNKVISVLPGEGFKDSSGDKESSVTKITAWELLIELLGFTNLNYGLMQLSWLALIAGNTFSYNVIMFCTIGCGIGLGGWGIYRFFTASRSKPKLQTTWRLFLWGLSLVAALIIHYVF
jgi:hypothetical protein